MKKLEDNFRKLVPYTPGEQPHFSDMIKLNTNENPYPPSPAVQAALKEYDSENLRLYPAPDSGELREKLAEVYGTDKNRIFTGVGSDDVLAIAFMALFNSGKPVLFPDVTYSFYDVWAELFKIPYRTPALDKDFKIVPEDYMTENGGIVIANPNAPTGLAAPESDLRKIIEANPETPVIIDEAYADFADENMLHLTKDYDNVVIVRTFSKSRSLAGMRIGFAISSEKIISAMNDVRYSFNSYPLTSLSVRLGTAALEDDEYFREKISAIKATREWTKNELKKLGFSFPDSKTNFIFAKPEKTDAVTIFEKLREKHIFVRHFDGERTKDYLRITIGTDEEMKTFIGELHRIID